MSIKHADLATAIRNASEGDDRALIDLPLAGASLGEMTIISCTGKIFNDLQAERRLSARQKDAIEHLRTEIDERTNDNDCLQLRLEELARTNEELARCNHEQTATIAALQREIAALQQPVHFYTPFHVEP